MPATDLPFRTATSLAAALRAKKISARELLDLYLTRVATHNPRLNAVVELATARARRRARAADRALAAGVRNRPLLGVPMTIKESFDVAGMRTSWGDPALKENVAAADALAVQRLEAAGAIVFGKTNVPLMLADWQTFNAIHGTTRNPFDPSRGPGGSSGGSAAALAAGLTGLEAGSDIGASIRNPAHYCGVYGHKPSWGIASPRGHALPGIVATSDISAIGPMARGAGDLAIALDAMAGPDAIDGRGWRLALPRDSRRSLRDFRVAVMLDDRNAEVDASVRDEIAKLAAFLRRSGAKVSLTARPAIDFDALMRVYIALLRAATSARITDAALARMVDEARRLAPDDESYRARMLRGNTMFHRDWLRANEQRHRMRLAWDAFFAEWDVILCPTATTAAFPHDQTGERWERMLDVNGGRQPGTEQMFWAGLGGVCYLPATVAPAGQTKDGLPVGVQIMSAQYRDHTTIRFAQLLERAWRGFVAPPGFA
jgi:amidase